MTCVSSSLMLENNMFSLVVIFSSKLCFLCRQCAKLLYGWLLTKFSISFIAMNNTQGTKLRGWVIIFYIFSQWNLVRITAVSLERTSMFVYGVCSKNKSRQFFLSLLYLVKLLKIWNVEWMKFFSWDFLYIQVSDELVITGIRGKYLMVY